MNLARGEQGIVSVARRIKDPHPLQNGIEGGGISTPGIPFRVPFSLVVGRLSKWNCGTPHLLPLCGGGGDDNSQDGRGNLILQVPPVDPR